MKEIESALSGASLNIGIVLSRFNQEVGNGLLYSCVAELGRLGVASHDIVVARVPGALEVPLVLQTMAQSGGFHGLIALGCVIRGQTYHFEIVSGESARGIAQVQLQEGIPVANGVLTTEDEAQALCRMTGKGTDVAQTVIEMIHLQSALLEELIE